MKTLSSLFASLLLLIALAACTDGEISETFNETYTLKMNKEGTLNMNTDGATVEIIRKDRSDLLLHVERSGTFEGYISLPNGGYELQYETMGGDVYINDMTRRRFLIDLGRRNVRYHISVEVPKCASFNIKADNDTYVISEIHEDVSKIDCPPAENVFSFDDGSLTVDQAYGDVNIEMDDGSIKLRDSAINNLDASFDDGTLYIETRLSDDGSYNINLDDGDVKFTPTSGSGIFSIESKKQNTTLSKEYVLEESIEEKITYRLGDGRASVTFKVDNGSLRLESR